jgi:hypothetical protein
MAIFIKDIKPQEARRGDIISRPVSSFFRHLFFASGFYLIDTKYGFFTSSDFGQYDN